MHAPLRRHLNQFAARTEFHLFAQARSFLKHTAAVEQLLCSHYTRTLFADDFPCVSRNAATFRPFGARRGESSARTRPRCVVRDLVDCWAHLHASEGRKYDRAVARALTFDV